MQTQDSALTQAAIRLIPTTEARFQFQARPCGICGGQSETNRCFSQQFDFPLSVSYRHCFINQPCVALSWQLTASINNAFLKICAKVVCFLSGRKLIFHCWCFDKIYALNAELFVRSTTRTIQPWQACGSVHYEITKFVWLIYDML